MAEHIFGLESIEVGTIEADGGIALTFSEVGETVVGTANMVSEDNTVTDIMIEESDSPIESISTAGKITFNWSSYKVDSATLALFLGGTATAYNSTGPVNEQWDAPDSFPDVEKSLQVTDKSGNVIQFPRVKISTKLGLSFTKDALGQLDFVATVLQPTKSGEKRMTIIYALPE
jgi:hypothetical protein